MNHKHKMLLHLGTGVRKSIVLIIVCFIAVAANARVFLSWGSAGQADRVFEGKGGTISYKGKMNINGKDGHVTIFRFNDSLPDVMRMIKTSFNTSEFNYAGGTMGLAAFKSSSLLTKLVAVRLNDTSLVFKIDQPLDSASRGAPTEHLMKEIQPFPSSVPVFYAKDENTNVSLAVSKSTASSGSIREFYRTSMESEGWYNPLPPTETGNEGMVMYIKDNQTACVMVNANDSNGETRITLLHKYQKIK